MPVVESTTVLLDSLHQFYHRRTSVTPNSSSSGTNVSRSLPLTPSASAVQHGPPQPPSLPESTTAPQQDTRPPSARGPNTAQMNSEMVFPDQSRPSPATADSASPARPPLLLSTPFSATSPSKSANGTSPSSAANSYSPSKPLPATNNGGLYKQETDRPPSSLDNP